MRTLLRLLGIVRGDARRREPVVLPAWVRRGAPIVVAGVVVVLAVLTTGVWLTIRSILP
jgi:hypothetical protein